MSAPRFESLCGLEYLSVISNTDDGSPIESSGRYYLSRCSSVGRAWDCSRL